MPEVVTEPYEGVDWEKFIVIQSNDQPKPTEYKLSRELVKMSSLIKDVLEDQTEGEQTVIPIPNVSGKTLNYVLQYMEHHENNKADPIEKPLKVKIADVISEWDKAFLFTDLIKGGDEKQHEELINVIMAANFLNVKDLLGLTCAAVASMVNGKTTEQIRTLFKGEAMAMALLRSAIFEQNRKNGNFEDLADGANFKELADGTKPNVQHAEEKHCAYHELEAKLAACAQEVKGKDKELAAKDTEIRTLQMRNSPDLKDLFEGAKAKQQAAEDKHRACQTKLNAKEQEVNKANKKIKGIEKQNARMVAALRDQLTALETRFADVSEECEKLREWKALCGPTTGALKMATARIAALEKEAAAFGQPPRPTHGLVACRTAEPDNVEGPPTVPATATASPAGLETLVSSLEEKVISLEHQLKQKDEHITRQIALITQNQAHLSRLEEQLTEAQGASDTAAAQHAEELAAMNHRLECEAAAHLATKKEEKTPSSACTPDSTAAMTIAMTPLLDRVQALSVENAQLQNRLISVSTTVTDQDGV